MKCGVLNGGGNAELGVEGRSGSRRDLKRPPVTPGAITGGCSEVLRLSLDKHAGTDLEADLGYLVHWQPGSPGMLPNRLFIGRVILTKDLAL